MPATPRFETKLDGKLDNWAPAIEQVASDLGWPLMPWQRSVAKLIGAHTNGKPRYDLIAVAIPRQQGKSALAKAVLTAKGEAEFDLRMFITAQTRLDASRHLEDLGLALSDMATTRLGVGNERITWDTGSTLELLSPTHTGAHGRSIDLAVVDEAWAIQPFVMAGLVPARVAKPNSQLIIISTMGTNESEVWNGIVARGRESVEDPDSKIAYVEYSAESDADVFDESKWPDFLPALGLTVSVESIRSARDSLPPNEFVRAFGNRTTSVINSVFPGDWVKDAWKVIEPSPNIVLSVEVNDDPAGASIASGHITEEGTAVRVLEWRYGSPRWVPDVVAKIIAERNVEAVVFDAGGPARAIQAELAAVCLNTALIDRRPRDLGADTTSFYDSLREGSVHIEHTAELEAAITSAHKKDIGDLWLISRKRMTVDASPLIAIIMAHGVAHQLDVTPAIRAFVL